MFLSSNDLDSPKPELPAGMFVDENEAAPANASSGRDAMNRNLARQRDIEAKKRKMKRQMSGMAMSTNEDDAYSGIRVPTAGSPSVREGLKLARAPSSSSSSSQSAIPTLSDDAAAAAVDSDEEQEEAGATLAISPERPTGTDAERKLFARGLSSVYDPTGGSSTPSASAAPMELDLSNLGQFCAKVPARGQTIQCIIKRSKQGIVKMFPKYTLHLQDGGHFLMCARKRKKNKSSNYLIALDEGEMKRKSEAYYGKVRSNFVGTSFSIFDKGSNPLKPGEMQTTATRHELGAVTYETNVLGTKGPRVMKAIVPSVTSANTVNSKPVSDSDTLLDRCKAGDSNGLVVLINKPPKWSDALGAFCLNFHGRVTVASVKNFQLVSEFDHENISLQFGKTDKDEFTMDYGYPLNALQAFGICLSSFDNKLMCE